MKGLLLKNKEGDSRIADMMIYVVYTLFALLCALPFYYIIVQTISDNYLVSTGQVFLIPRGIHFRNIVSALKLDGMLMAAMVSIARTVVGTLFTLIGTTILGYAFSRREYWHRQFWYRFIILTMYFSTGLIPGFMNMKNLRLYDTFWLYVVPGTVSAYFMILYKTFVESIPASLEESAQLDGAGYAVRYARIILPLSLPMIATICIFAAVGQWSAFSDTLYMVSDSRLYTLQFKLYQFMNQAEQLAASMRSAGGNISSAAMEAELRNLMSSTSIRTSVCLIVTLPVLLIYPFFQRYFIKGIMIGAVKG